MGTMLGMGAAFMPLQFCAAPKKEADTVAENPLTKSKLDSFGIQLYSVKEDMGTDAQATMRALAIDDLLKRLYASSIEGQIFIFDI